jgi:hypothetical protein
MNSDILYEPEPYIVLGMNISPRVTKVIFKNTGSRCRLNLVISFLFIITTYMVLLKLIITHDLLN